MYKAFTVSALCLAVAGCASLGTDSTPSPLQCRAAGVAVADNDPITGKIVEANIGTLEKVSAVCRSPWHPNAGCALPVFPGEYVIWSIDDPTVITHEQCHALFEKFAHVLRSGIRSDAESTADPQAPGAR